MKSTALPFLSVSCLFIGSLAAGQAATSTTPAGAHEYHFTVSTSQTWTDTGVDLQPNDSLEITAASGENCDPAGSSGTAPKGADLPVPSAPAGALITKTAQQEPALFVGGGKQLKVTDAGHLFLGANSKGTPACVGSFSVKVSITPTQGASSSTPVAANSLNTTSTSATTGTAGQTPATGQSNDIKKKLQSAAQVWLSGQFGNGTSTAATTSSNATAGSAATAGAAPVAALKVSDTPLDPRLRKEIDGLPRRVNDQFKNEGDMVNFVLVGSEEQVKAAVDAATWHIADTDNRESALKAVLETYQKKDYLTMPMSQLYLFGRVQDFGYEEAEPYSVVASRHHFRLWKTPVTWNGQTVWAGAGTHDIGFEKDQRNGKVTHKIDPAVDGERDNIGQTLQNSTKAKSMTYYLPLDAVKEAKNATGGGYHSDGRILVVFLE